MTVKNIKRDHPLNKWQAWLYKRAPAWIIKEGDPRGTVVRMVLVVLSFSPLIGLLAFCMRHLQFRRNMPAKMNGESCHSFPGNQAQLSANLIGLTYNGTPKGRAGSIPAAGTK